MRKTKFSYYSKCLEESNNKQHRLWLIVNEVTGKTCIRYSDIKDNLNFLNNFYYTVACNLTKDLSPVCDRLSYSSNATLPESFYL